MTCRRLCTDLSTGIGSNPGGKTTLGALVLGLRLPDLTDIEPCHCLARNKGRPGGVTHQNFWLCTQLALNDCLFHIS